MEEDKNKQLNDSEEQVHYDPPGEEEFTKAMEKMDDTDRDIFENTGVIHVDRDMPAETQAMHVVRLQKKHDKKRKKVFHFIEALLAVGVIVSGAGLYLNRHRSEEEMKRREEVSKNQASVSSDTELTAINDASFPDSTFQRYIRENIDTNGDGSLSSDETDAVIIITMPQDEAVTDLTGIAYFHNLQSLIISNTAISSLDLSQNTKLSYLDVSNTQIQSLDLRENTKLKAVEAVNTPLTVLTLPEKSKIDELDVSGTSLNCTKNTKGIYTGCSIAQ